MDRLLHLRWERCRETNVSMTVATPPPRRAQETFRTRVRNQRRTTAAVIGFCDAPAHGTSARLCPRLHHRPTPQLQVDALQRAGWYRVFTETASGARADRPVLAQVLDQLRPGDTLCRHRASSQPPSRLLVGQAGCSPFRRPAPRLPLDDRPPQLQAGAPGPAAAGAWCMPDRPAGGPKLSWPILSRSYLTKRKESLRSVTGPLGPTGPYRRRTRLARRQQMADSLRRGAYLVPRQARFALLG